MHLVWHDEMIVSDHHRHLMHLPIEMVVASVLFPICLQKNRTMNDDEDDDGASVQVCTDASTEAFAILPHHR